MARKLARTVHVTDPETRKVVAFAAGETPPSWAADQITNAAAWGDDVSSAVAEAAEDGPPAKSDNKPDWVAYAVSQGMTEEDAEAMTKDDLVETFGG